MTEEQKKYSKEYKKIWRSKPENKVKEKIRRDNWNKKNPNWFKEYYKENRLKCIEYYSNGRFNCECCGDSNLEFLTIDHINGGGRKHRKEIGSHRLYDWLIKNNFPTGFRILCFNCNQCLGIYGYCPHQKLI